MPRRLLVTAASAALVLAGLSGCGDDDDSAGDTVDSLVEEGRDAVTTASSEIDEGATAAAEAAARTLAAEHGEDQFDDAGHDIDDDLTCEATAVDGNAAIEISCTGTTEDGGAAELTGTTSELPGASATELEGDFTGTVDGEEVFQTDRLGDT